MRRKNVKDRLERRTEGTKVMDEKEGHKRRKNEKE